MRDLEIIILNDVLFTLYCAEVLNWKELNRTNFQKILYFCSVLSPLVGIEWLYDFTNANYGPFNTKIHNAPDKLVHYRDAIPTSVTLQIDSKLRASYKITNQGIDKVHEICKLKKEKDRYNWINVIMKVLDIYGPKIVTKLAYKEPTFHEMRSQNRGGIIELDAEDNQSLSLIKDLSYELNKNYSLQLDTLISKLIVYFDYLSKGIGTETQR